MLTIPQQSCFTNFKIAMIKYCNFEGRARRSEFWYFKLSISIIDFIYAFIAKLILAIVNNETNAEEIEKLDIADSIPLLVIGIVIGVIFILPNISVSVRRLHDVGKSGYYYFLNLIQLIGTLILLYYYFLNLIPLIGTLILLYYYLQDSYPDANEYGDSTKYIQPVNDFSRKNPLINNNENEMQEIP